MRRLRLGRGAARHTAFLLLLLLLLLPTACGTSDGNGKEDTTPATADATDEPGIDSTGDEDIVPVPDQTVEPDVCVPQCEGKACGSDGCDGVCGHCYTMEGALNDDLCLEDGTCTPCGCGDQECGVDLCGSPCGTCAGDWICNDQNLCEAPPIPCDFKGFHAVEEYAKLKNEATGGFTLHYQGMNKAAAPFDVIVMDLDTAAGGPTGPGIYDVTYDNFHTGGIYLYVLKNWNGQSYEDLYVPTAGTIEITALSPEGGNLEAILHDVVMEQAKYNGDTDAPDFVQHGKIWCVDNVKMLTDLNVTKQYCVAEGTGYGLGDNIGDFQLQRCDGQWGSLHSFCEQKKAVWIVATAGW